MKIRVVDGGQLVCYEVVQQFPWRMQGITLMADVLLLPLGGSGIILGVQWYFGGDSLGFLEAHNANLVSRTKSDTIGCT